MAANLLEKIKRLEEFVQSEGGKPEVYLELMLLYEYIHPSKTAHYFSLIRATEAEKESRIWVKALVNSTGFLITKTLIQEAIKNVDLALALAGKYNYTKEKLNASFYKFFLLAYEGKQDEANQLLTWCENQMPFNNDIKTAIHFYQIAGDFCLQTDFKKSGEYLFKAAELSREHNLPCDEANALAKITDWCEFTGDYESGYRYADEAIKKAEEQGALTIVLQASLFAVNLGFKTSKTERAEIDANRALAITEQMGEEPLYYYVLQKKTYILATLNKYDEAIILQQKLLNIGIAKNDTLAMAGAYMSLGRSYFHTQKYQEALHCLTEYKNLKGEQIRLNDLNLYYWDISRVHAALGNHQLAYNHLFDYIEIQKKLQDEARAKEMSAMQAKYETKKKEVEFKKLELENLEMELKAIKAQMNPHFIFNVMNTVDSLIGANQNEDARNAIRKFSALMRDTLQHSNNQFITLEEEIELLRNYIELEKLSLGQSFTYTITQHGALDTSYTKIPSMLLQPIVENAIKHGLRHLPSEKKLHLDFEYVNDELYHVTITDNGIGRIKSEQINANRKNHQSFATNAIEQRIAAINQSNTMQINLQIEDAFLEKENTGTKVSLIFKQKYSTDIS
jgi:hypothetical protein